MLKQASFGQRSKGDSSMPSAQGHRLSQQPGMHHQGKNMHANLSSQMARPPVPQLLSYSTPRAPRLLERTPASAEKTQCITQKSAPTATRAVQDAISIQHKMPCQTDDSALMSARLLRTTLEYAVYDGASPPSTSPASGQPDTEQVPPLPAPSPEPPLPLLPSRPIAMGCATTRGRTIDDDSLLALAVIEPRLTRSPPPPLQLTGSTSPTRSTPPTPLPRVSDILNVPIVPFSLPLFGTYEEHDHPRPCPSSVKNWIAVSNTGQKLESNKPKGPNARNWLTCEATEDRPEISSRDTLMGTAGALLQFSRTQPTNTWQAFINGPTPNDPISQTDMIVLFDQALDENRLRRANLDKITRERESTLGHILDQSKGEGNFDEQVDGAVCEAGVEILSNDMHQQPVLQHQAEFEARPSSKRAQQSEGPGLQRKGPMDSKVEMQQQQQKTPSRIPSVSAMSAMAAAANQQKKTPARMPSASAVSAMAAAAHEQRKKNETANKTTKLEITKPKQENQASEALSNEVSDFSHEITSKEISKTVTKEREVIVKEEADIITEVKASGAQIPSTAPISIADAASVAETVEGESGCKEGALGGNGGVGIAIMIQHGKVVVTGVKKGGSAHNAGIILADCIVSIDGQPLDSKNEAEVKALISGEPGSVVRVHAIRKSAFFGMTTHIKVDLVRELPCSQNAEIKVLCIKKSDIKIDSHGVHGGSTDSDQATVAPWPGHVTSPEEDGGLSKCKTSVFKVAKSTPALAQTPSKTQAQAHAQMRNETTTLARKQNFIKFGGCRMDPIGEIFDANTASEDWNPVYSLQSDALAYAQHQEVELGKTLSFQRTSSLEKDMIGSNPRENGDGWEHEQSLKVQTDASAGEESTKNLDNGDREIDNDNEMAAHYVDVISEHVARLQQQSQLTKKINENQQQHQNLEKGDKQLRNDQAMAEHYADSVIENAAGLQQQSQRTKKIMENQHQHPSIPPTSCSSPSPPSKRTIHRSSSQRYGFNQSEGKYQHHFAGTPVLNTLTARINTTFEQCKGNDNQLQHSKSLQVNQNYKHVVSVPAYKGAYKDPYMGTK